MNVLKPMPMKQKQQIAATPCKLFALTLFAFLSQFAAIGRELYDILMTAGA